MADWALVRAEYINGTASLATVAKKHGVTRAAIQKRSEREGWAETRRQATAKVSAEADQALAEARANALKEWNDADLQIARALRAQVARKISEARDRGILPRDLRALASTAEAAQKMGRLALGVSTDNVGHGGPGGVGPIAVASVPVDAYLEARRKILSEF